MARTIMLNGMVETGAVIVPATAMVVVGQTWLAAAIVGTALVASMVQARCRARASIERHQRLLATAEHAWNIGADPTQVVKAVRGAADDPDDHDEARPAGDAGPWLHLPPTGRR